LTDLPPLGVYVHWPYCARICPYCDFNVVRDRKQAEQADLAAAILADLETQRALTGPRRLVSVFLGGGTPSLMDPQWAADIVGAARRLFDSAPVLEVILDANPTDAEAGRFAAFGEAGVHPQSVALQVFRLAPTDVPARQPRHKRRLGTRARDSSRQQHTRDRRKGTNRNLRQSKRGGRFREDHVTRQRHLESPAEAPPAHDGHRGHRQREQVKAQSIHVGQDLFDHTRVKGDVIEFVYAQLARVACPTVIIAGNHDCWQERSILQRMDFRHAGHHVTLLDEPEGTTVEFPELHATVWGR